MVLKMLQCRVALNLKLMTQGLGTVIGAVNGADCDVLVRSILFAQVFPIRRELFAVTAPRRIKLDKWVLFRCHHQAVPVFEQVHPFVNFTVYLLSALRAVPQFLDNFVDQKCATVVTIQIMLRPHFE